MGRERTPTMTRILRPTVLALAGLAAMLCTASPALADTYAEGPWVTAKPAAGKYWAFASCPRGKAAGSGLDVRTWVDGQWVVSPYPERFVRAQLGLTADGGAYAFIKADKGPRFQFRAVAVCR